MTALDMRTRRLPDAVAAAIDGPVGARRRLDLGGRHRPRADVADPDAGHRVEPATDRPVVRGRQPRADPGDDFVGPVRGRPARPEVAVGDLYEFHDLKRRRSLRAAPQSPHHSPPCHQVDHRTDLAAGGDDRQCRHADRRRTGRAVGERAVLGILFPRRRRRVPGDGHQPRLSDRRREGRSKAAPRPLAAGSGRGRPTGAGGSRATSCRSRRSIPALVTVRAIPTSST